MIRILFQKDDHPGYSCERAPWALVTGVGPLALNAGKGYARLAAASTAAMLAVFEDHELSRTYLNIGLVGRSPPATLCRGGGSFGKSGAFSKPLLPATQGRRGESDFEIGSSLIYSSTRRKAFPVLLFWGNHG